MAHKDERKKFLESFRPTKDELPVTNIVTFARLSRKGAAWEVLAVDLPSEVVEKYQRIAAEIDLLPHQERKLLIEARKTDLEKWK